MGKHRWFLLNFYTKKCVPESAWEKIKMLWGQIIVAWPCQNDVVTFSACISDQNIFFEMTIFADWWHAVQEKISLIQFQPSHGAVDFLRNLDVFHWENPNPDSCFYFKAANSLLKEKRPTLWGIKKQEKSCSKKSEQTRRCYHPIKNKTKTCNSSNLQWLSITWNV